MKKGERAASAGILLSRAALLKILRDLEARAKKAEAAASRAKKDADARVDNAKRVAKAEVAGANALAAACEGDKLRRERIYEDALKRCPKPTAAWKWYLATGVGAIVAGGLCVGGVAASR
jgi:thioesterase domain-containing protein